MKCRTNNFSRSIINRARIFKQLYIFFLSIDLVFFLLIENIASATEAISFTCITRIYYNVFIDVRGRLHIIKNNILIVIAYLCIFRPISKFIAY